MFLLMSRTVKGYREIIQKSPDLSKYIEPAIIWYGPELFKLMDDPVSMTREKILVLTLLYPSATFKTTDEKKRHFI